MDIQEIKNFTKNKIEADNLAKQVRRRIKETAWEKQNQREGFSETFKPLISQFEKPEDSKKENIFTQNQKMLQNQLALTEGLKANQKAITDGLVFNQELQKIKPFDFDYDDYDDDDDNDDDYDDDDYDDDDVFTGTYDEYQDSKQEKPTPSSSESSKEIIDIDFKKGFSKKQQKKIEEKSLLKLEDLPKADEDNLKSNLYKTNEEIKSLRGQIGGKENGITGLEKKVNKGKDSKKKLELLEQLTNLKKEQYSRKKFMKTLRDYKERVEIAIGGSELKKDKKSGKGIMSYYSPQELIKRFELLGGSLAAGNNGVLHEYIQIAHRLRDLGIVTNKQLNKLLRNYLNIR